jgi:hypothetical protein
VLDLAFWPTEEPPFIYKAAAGLDHRRFTAAAHLGDLHAQRAEDLLFFAKAYAL